MFPSAQQPRSLRTAVELPRSVQARAAPYFKWDKSLHILSQVNHAADLVICDRYFVSKCNAIKILHLVLNSCTVSESFRLPFYPACNHFQPSGPIIDAAKVENCIFVSILSFDMIIFKPQTLHLCLAFLSLVKRTETIKILLLVRQLLFPEMTFMLIFFAFRSRCKLAF